MSPSIFWAYLAVFNPLFRKQKVNHLLFVPASRPERFAKALNSGVSAVIIDLEDAVAIDEKDHARAQLAQWLQANPQEQVLVRINALGTPWHEQDLHLCREPNVLGVVVPKAEQPGDLQRMAQACGQALYPIIETATGLSLVRTIANTHGVARLLYGKLDLAVDLGMDYPAPAGEDDAETVFLFARSELVLASRAAGLDAPIDGVYTQLDDEAGLFTYARRSARFGFAGVLLVHPKQLSAVQRAYAPTAAQIDWAQRIIAAAEQSNGAAVSLDGAMVDAPVIARARNILARASS